MEIHRGDIYWVEFITKEDSIQNGTRPAIISSNDLNNKFCPNVQVIPLTSNLEKADLPVHVYIGEENGLIRPSLALIEAETTVAKKRVGSYIGTCTIQTMRNVEKAIQIQKGINDPFDINRAMKLIKAIKNADRFINEFQLDREELTFRNALVDELKIYCSSYGKDYRKVLKYYNDMQSQVKIVQYA